MRIARIVGLSLVASVFPVSVLLLNFSGHDLHESVSYSLLLSLAMWAIAVGAWMLLSIGKLVVESGRDGLIGVGLFTALCLIAIPAVQELGALTAGA